MWAHIDGILQVLAAFFACSATVISFINRRKINEVHVSINSRMDQLLTERGIAAKAEGVIEGQQKAVANMGLTSDVDKTS